MRGSVTFEGKRYYVSGKTRDEVIAKKAIKLKELEEGKRRISKSMTVSAWAEECLNTYKANQADVTRTKYRNRMQHCVLDEIGDMPLSMVKSIHLQKILNNQKEFSQRHINEVHQIINLIFNKAYENGLIIDNPIRGLVRPKGYTHIRRSLTKEEEEKMLPLLQEEKYILFALMYYAGLRPSEARNIKPTDIIDVDGERMFYIRGTKTDNAMRFIPISAQLVDTLKKASENEYLAVNQYGKKFSESATRDRWRMLKKESGIDSEDLVPYCLRHSFCTNLQKNGVPLKVAQTLMGHSDISLTANIYTHVDTEQLLKYKDVI